MSMTYCVVRPKRSFWVKRVILTVGLHFPVYPDERTLLRSGVMSRKCQKARPLKSNFKGRAIRKRCFSSSRYGLFTAPLVSSDETCFGSGFALVHKRGHC